MTADRLEIPALTSCLRNDRTLRAARKPHGRTSLSATRILSPSRGRRTRTRSWLNESLAQETGGAEALLRGLVARSGERFVYLVVNQGNMLQEALRYSRMAAALRRHLRAPLDPDPERSIRHYFENRETHFLSLARKVLADPGHPYAQLFGIAGCSYADLETAVRARGIESTLQALLEEGVYVSHDEFRGRKPIVRGGKHIPSSAASWLNAQGRGGIAYTSSGSSGKPVATEGSSAQMAHIEAHWLLMVRELDLADRANVLVGPGLPGFGVVALLLVGRSLGFERWFAIGGRNCRNLAYRAVTRYLVAGSIPGIPCPIPGLPRTE